MEDNFATQPGETVALTEREPPFHILIVDDDNDIRQLVMTTLKCSGFKVNGARDGAAAWHLLNLDSYDLLVTDNSMPKVSGVELLKKMHSARMALPVIMATGILPEEEFIQLPWLRPNATLLKPYTMAELLSTVKSIMAETHKEALRATNGSGEQVASPPVSPPIQLR